MAIDAIGVTASQSTTTLTSSAGIGQEDFMRILLTQLQFQDPLKPVDNQQFIAQLAQFSALEINRQQSEKIDTLLTVQSADQAIGLLGKSIEIAGEQNAGAVGQVTAVSFATGEPRLTVRTDTTTLVDVRLSDINLIRQ